MHITIIGVGLIGGSLGLAWKKYVPGIHITGCDLPQVLDEAQALGVIDVAEPEPAAAVAKADIVVVAVPLGAVSEVFTLIAPHLRAGTIVTDVGSVKSPVVAIARDTLSRDTPFIGGHPMAGSEKGGVAHANALLFENATYVLCPPDGMNAGTFLADFGTFIGLVASTGARLLTLDADRHDRIAAAVSHLPQLLAVTLMNDAAGLNAEDDAFLRLAAGGFRDMTRIASSPFDIWRDILAANKAPVISALDRFSVALRDLREAVTTGDLDEIAGRFENARRVRDTIPKNTKGFLHPLADVHVYADDRPGVLHAITGTLLETGLNIKDIELLKIREGMGGAFRMSFADESDASRAVEALMQAGFTAYRV